MAKETTQQRPGTDQADREAARYAPQSGSRDATRDRERAISTNREADQRVRGTGMTARPQSGLTGLGTFDGGASPFSLMQRMADDMDRLFGQFGLGRLGLRPDLGLDMPQADSAWSPQVEVFERGDMLIVRADVPGVAREDLHVEVEQDVLSIRGERRVEREEEDRGYYRSERSYGQFYRAIPLPDGVDPDSCEASYRDGVLEVTIPAPKRQEQRGRRIQIR